MGDSAETPAGSETEKVSSVAADSELSAARFRPPMCSGTLPPTETKRPAGSFRNGIWIVCRQRFRRLIQEECLFGPDLRRAHFGEGECQGVKGSILPRGLRRYNTLSI